MAALKENVGAHYTLDSITVKVSEFTEVKRIIKSAATFVYIAAGIVAFLCFYEIVFGTGVPVHPIWDNTYNWLPLIFQLTSLSFLGGVTYSLLPKVSPSVLRHTLSSSLLRLAYSSWSLLSGSVPAGYKTPSSTEPSYLRN